MRPELEQAAALLRQNTPEAVAEAIALLQRTVFAFSMKVCGHAEDAEDTMQEVLMRSAPHLARLTEANALAVWLYTVTRHRCWRMRRKPAAAPAHTLSLDELMPDEQELAALAERATPEDAAASDEMARLVHGAVLAIPPQYRIVLVLHDMEDLDVEQIARVLDLKPGTVRVRLHRARLAVRRAMAARLGAPASIPRSGTGSVAGYAAGKAAGGPAKAAAKRRRPARGGVAANQESRAARLPACREIFAQLSEFLDERLPRPDCQRMARHIDRCPNCVLFLNDLRQAIERCRSLDARCDAQVGAALRAQLTREYLRLIAHSAA